jgi:hypothetical protein
MYGKFDYSLRYSDKKISFGFRKKGNYFEYYREGPDGEKITKRLISRTGSVVVNPVEPLNLPETVTNYLEIEFSSIFIEPNQKFQIFLKFPIEIGVFVVAQKDMEEIDIFSFVSQKYSLYGPPSGGIITRWYYSDVHSKYPETDPIREGVISLEIENATSEWAEVSRVVFDGYAMKIFYDGRVIMQAKMKIGSSHSAETSFESTTPQTGMTKSIELYTARKLPAVKKTFLMEWGLV